MLARAGFGSRRVCENLIAAGRVTVDGEIAALGRRVDPATDRIELDGIRVIVDQSLVHYLLNKPVGVVTTASDPQARQVVVDLVPSEPRVFPVGRLDVDTAGLIVLTNDGDFANRLAHPRHGIEKTYLAELEGVPASADIQRLRTGVWLDDRVTAPARVQLVDRRSGSSAVEITIHEGRNRQVRRMCDEIGHPVIRLVRTRLGPISDPKLAPGEWRVLTVSEIRALYAASESDAQDSRPLR